MGIGRKIWQWNLKSAPLYWFAQGKYKKGLGLWAMWIALWTVLAFALAPKPKTKQSITSNNNIKEKEYSNA
jgi:hypothetical protein